MIDAAVLERFFVDDLGLDLGTPVDRGRDLLDSGLLDSMGITQTVTFLEESFEIEVEDEDLVPENFRSIEAIAAFAGRRAG
jgi:acyl carrier protein